MVEALPMTNAAAAVPGDEEQLGAAAGNGVEYDGEEDEDYDEEGAPAGQQDEEGQGDNGAGEADGEGPDAIAAAD